MATISTSNCPDWKIVKRKQIYKPNKKKQQTIALKNLNDLPQPLRNDKLVLLMELSAAQYLGGKQLNETIVKFNQIFPDDPIVDLVVLDYLFWNKQTVKNTANRHW